MVRCIVLTKLVLALVLLPFIGGCSVLRLNEGRHFAISSAGYAGRFRLAYGRWPDIDELEDFACMRGRADRFGLAQISCDELVRKPYRTEMSSRGSYLEMRFFDLAKRPVCSLRVLTPPPGNEADVFPMIVIKTGLMSCRGDGKRCGEYSLEGSSVE